MADSVKEPKRIPKEKRCTTLHVFSSVLSVVAILLTIAQFVRLEVQLAVVHEIKMMDSKFSQEIQQVKDALEKAAKPQASMNKDLDAVRGRWLQDTFYERNRDIGQSCLPERVKHNSYRARRGI